MTTARIGVTSRLQKSDLLEVDGETFWDLTPVDAIPPQPDDSAYTVIATDRIDLLANTFYGDSTLWWVIAYRNDLELFPGDLVVGDVLMIPSLNFVRNKLFAE